MSEHDSVTKISHILNGLTTENAMMQKSINASSTARDIELDVREERSTKQLKSPEASVFSASNHHTNPFLYTQFRSRATIPFAAESIKGVDLVSPLEDIPARVFHEKTGLFYQITPRSIPTFVVAKKDLPDPIKFYESVQDLGAIYGCVKLKVLPDTDKFSQLNIDIDHFWFKARKQSFDSNELQKIIDFHAKLDNFHTKSGKKSFLTRIPSIDKRTLDLYRLRSCVKLRGGFDAVCKKKLWAQIGRELGYSGRIMSSLSTSLRSAYAKILLDFDKYEEEQQRINNNETIEVPIEPPTTLHHAELKKREGETSLHRGGSSHKRIKINRKAFRARSINHEFKRMKEIKHMKGFPTYFDSLTEFKLSYTESTEATLPGYDFTFWENGMEIYDKSVFETKTSPVYNLRQYYEKSQAVFDAIMTEYRNEYPVLFANETKLPQKEFERLYFFMLSKHFIEFEIDTGLGLTASIRSSGNDTFDKKNGIRDILDQWNLDNIPLSEYSLLKHLDLDMADLTRTNYDVGMLFSCQGWSVSDHFLPLVNYNHLGSAKLIYSIAPEDMGKFEDLIARGKKEWDVLQSRSRYFTSDEELKIFSETGFFKSFLEAEQSANLPDTVNSSRNSPAGSIPLGNGLQSDLQFEPDFILTNGIKLYKTTQEQGSYIFKFPKAFTCCIGSGFYLSQNATFAPNSWLRSSFEAARWVSKMGILPGLDAIQLITNVLIYSDNDDLKDKCRNLISDYVYEELENRKKLRELFGTVDVVYNKLNFISDISLEPTGLSKIVVTLDALQHIFSLKEFLKLLEKSKDDNYRICGIPIHDQAGNLNICLHLYFDKASLSVALNNLADPLNSDLAALDENFEMKWNALMTSTFKNRTVPLNIIQYLLSHTDSNSGFNRMLRSNFDDALLLMEECKRIVIAFMKFSGGVENVDFGKGFNLRYLPLEFSNSVVNKLKNLYERVQKCSVDFPEKLEIVRLYHISRQFPIDNREIIDGNNLNLLKELYQRSLSIPLKASYWIKLTRKICRLEWLSVYEHIFVERNNIKNENLKNYSLSLLYSYLEFGLKYCDVEDINKISNVRELLLRYQEIIQKIQELLRKETSSKILLSDLENILLGIEAYRLPIQGNFFSELNYVIKEIEHARRDIGVDIIYNSDCLDRIDELIRKNDPKFVMFVDQFNGSRLDKRPFVSDNQDRMGNKQEQKSYKSWSHHLGRLLHKNELTKLLPLVFRCLDLESDEYISLENCAKRQTKYCFCRKIEEGLAMVECEICKEWYHIQCINDGKWAPPDDPNVLFVCPICTPSNVITKATESVLFEFGDLKRLLIDSLKLSVIPDPPVLKNLFEIFAAALNFKNQMETELFTKGFINQSISTHKIKYYLKKSQGSKCGFTDLTGPLRRYCQSKNADLIKQLKENGRTIITGFPN
ncbi:ecm5p [Saccharomyces arboricola H-6]|uniref:Ecm5p n=1 Tax=Saccharomyces arboricola (strain H-6 / AS 2.3317 / CBS 10644) TaxID=1160507 RepID=J8Q3E8_SACAR|nr:ecm5p [Saccharomyces arboricola H-6]